VPTRRVPFSSVRSRFGKRRSVARPERKTADRNEKEKTQKHGAIQFRKQNSETAHVVNPSSAPAQEMGKRKQTERAESRKRNKKAKRTRSPEFEFQGISVAKRFNGILWKGIVDAYDEHEQYWRVTYTDGDQEEYTREDLYTIVLNKRDLPRKKAELEKILRERFKTLPAKRSRAVG
jgi:hypothetical protein